MNSTARVPATEVTGIYGWIVKRGTRMMLGKEPESLPIAWQHPPAFKALMGLGRKSEKWDELDPTLATYAAMATAATIGCHTCLDLHHFMAHKKGLDEAKIQQVPHWRESEAFTPTERRVMEYAAAMCQLPVAVTDEMSAALLEDLGAPALVELTARVAVMNLNARMNVALGMPVEGLAETCGLQPLAAPRAGVPSSP